MALRQNNFFAGTAPSDIPQRLTLPEHSAGVSAAAFTGAVSGVSGASLAGSAIASNAGPATGGAGMPGQGQTMMDMLGLGAGLNNPAGFAAQVNPIGGKAQGTNLFPGVDATKGAGDIATLDPRTWYPGIMTLFHTTRKPGGATSQ